MTLYRKMKNLALLTCIATVTVGLAPSYARHRSGDGAWQRSGIHLPLNPGSGVRPEPLYPTSGFHPGPFHPAKGEDAGR
jgi:hypothetical protein